MNENVGEHNEAVATLASLSPTISNVLTPSPKIFFSHDDTSSNQTTILNFINDSVISYLKSPSITPTMTPTAVSDMNMSTHNDSLEIDLGQKLEMPSSSPTSSTMDASEAFYKTAFVIAPRISASIGIIGSILILIDVWRRGKRKRKAQHRILLGMSALNIYTSIWTGLSSYPVKGGVVSNQALCSAQGWGLQMSIAGPIYNTMLAAFYLLVIRYKWNEGRLRKMEYFFHGLPLIFGITTSFAGLGLKLYNNAIVWCWISSYPSTCKGSYNNNGVNDCIRGNNAQTYRQVQVNSVVFYFGPFSSSFHFSSMLEWLFIMVHFFLPFFCQYS